MHGREHIKSSSAVQDPRRLNGAPGKAHLKSRNEVYVPGVIVSGTRIPVHNYRVAPREPAKRPPFTVRLARPESPAPVTLHRPVSASEYLAPSLPEVLAAQMDRPIPQRLELRLCLLVSLTRSCCGIRLARSRLQDQRGGRVSRPLRIVVVRVRSQVANGIDH